MKARPRAHATELRVAQLRKFAEAHPVGTVMPCTVHVTTPRGDGSLIYTEKVLAVKIRRFDRATLLVHVEELCTGEIRYVNLGWFEEAERAR